MALTVLIRLPQGEPLAACFDSPRVVIGRSKRCELILPDASVSARHATIRSEGAGNLVIDEGSVNGIVVGNVKLPAHTPRAVRDGELVRVGRVWLELCFGVGVPSPKGHAEAIALEMLRRQLEQVGESTAPALEVVDGPDRGLAIELAEGDREYVIGRARDADVTLADELLSRRHAGLRQVGGRWLVRDLGSKGGSTLDGEALEAEAPWLGGELCLGHTRLALRDTLHEAFDEALAGADVRMLPREYQEPPPGHDPGPLVEAPTEHGGAEHGGAEHADPDRAPEPTPTPSDTLPQHGLEPRGAGFATVDTAVVLVALGLLALSIAGLWWLLG